MNSPYYFYILDLKNSTTTPPKAARFIAAYNIKVTDTRDKFLQKLTDDIEEEIEMDGTKIFVEPVWKWLLT